MNESEKGKGNWVIGCMALIVISAVAGVSVSFITDKTAETAVKWGLITLAVFGLIAYHEVDKVRRN